MNWGKSIVFAFVLFAAFIGTLVAVCVRQDISLVSKNYYNEEGAYQARLAAAGNTSRLAQQPDIEVVEKYLLKVTISGLEDVQHGEVVLFSPATAKQDSTFRLRPGEKPFQLFDISAMKRGVYHARMSWTVNGQSFYFERTVYR